MKIIGYLAASLTMFGFIPQIIKSLKTKSTGDISLFGLYQLALGIILWLVYAYCNKDYPLFINNLVTFLSLSFLVILYFKYNKNYNEEHLLHSESEYIVDVAYQEKHRNSWILFLMLMRAFLCEKETQSDSEK